MFLFIIIKTRVIMTQCKIEGYILAGVILTMCLFTSLYTEAQPLVNQQEEKVTFYIKNDLDRSVLLKIGKSTVAMDSGVTKKFHRPSDSFIYLANSNIMAFLPEKGKKILMVDNKIQGKKILLSVIVPE